MSDLPPGQPDKNKMNSRRDWKPSRHLEVYRLRGSNPGHRQREKGRENSLANKLLPAKLVCRYRMENEEEEGEEGL